MVPTTRNLTAPPTPARKGEVWGVFCEFKAWSISYTCRCCSILNICDNEPCYKEVLLYYIIRIQTNWNYSKHLINSSFILFLFSYVTQIYLTISSTSKIYPGLSPKSVWFYGLHVNNPTIDEYYEVGLLVFHSNLKGYHLVTPHKIGLVHDNRRPAIIYTKVNVILD